MHMMKRFSLMVATALGIFLLAPTGETRDAGIAASLPSVGVSLDRLGTMSVDPVSLEGQGNTLYASSHCCNQNDSSCCAPRTPLGEAEIPLSPDSQCFNLAELSTADVSVIFGDNASQEESHCCTDVVDYCCPENYPEKVVEDSVLLQSQSLDIAQFHIVSGASSIDDNPLQELSQCCNENNTTCCPDAILPGQDADFVPPSPTNYVSAFLEQYGSSPLDAMGSFEYSYCCNEDDDTCCPEMRSPLLDTISKDPRAWLLGSYGVPTEELQDWSIAFVTPAAFSEWFKRLYCCNEDLGIDTCCALEVGDGGAGWFEVLPGTVQMWFDREQQARVMCLE